MQERGRRNRWNAKDFPEDLTPSLAGETDTARVAVLRACDAVGAFIEYWGFKEIHGRVWTFLALHDEPVAQVRVSEGLGLSRAAVSIAVKELSAYGLVRRVGDERLSPYEAVVDVWPIITKVLEGRERHLLDEAREALLAGVRALRETKMQGELSQFSEERLLVLLSLTDMARAGLGAILRIRLPGNMGKLRKRFDTLRGILGVFRLW